ncbi:MAG: acetyl-CoA C-acetyltransferase, partial [Alphaproteobacteria bacterium]
MSTDPVVIVGMARTPMGSFNGVLSDASGPDLGAAAIKAALGRSGVAAADVDEVILGCVLPHGQRQGPARQAAIYAGIPDATGATTINKLCGSGMKATMQGYDGLMAGSIDVAVTGGFESMTNIPYMIPKARQGYRMGHGQILDAMFWDGLEDAYEPGQLMGHF